MVMIMEPWKHVACILGKPIQSRWGAGITVLVKGYVGLIAECISMCALAGKLG